MDWHQHISYLSPCDQNQMCVKTAWVITMQSKCSSERLLSRFNLKTCQSIAITSSFYIFFPLHSLSQLLHGSRKLSLQLLHFIAEQQVSHNYLVRPKKKWFDWRNIKKKIRVVRSDFLGFFKSYLITCFWELFSGWMFENDWK